ncbi:hypothetical protein ACMD2_03614 [Ananas comosus]|uniref:Uncharacterized protein n=1 Tax=Ananas comosus TaxID=4615 RepID=A0A199W4W8_ANACO|nr:hypothetical protein ACMD2_03614 [Ananas comosus]
MAILSALRVSMLYPPPPPPPPPPHAHAHLPRARAPSPTPHAHLPRARAPSPKKQESRIGASRREDETICRETCLYSAVKSIFGPFAELVKTWNLPDWLVHWGHPANMAVVLFAMGGYGTYLGFRIRFSDDVEEKAKAKDLHPKLLGGMFFFFALGATGGITALLTSDKPIFESPHAVTGFIGLALLTVQSILPALFEGNPGLRMAHGLLGSSIMTLFLVHAALGLQLGLSF